MKSIPKSRLTGSRKKSGSHRRTPRPKSQTNRLDILDALSERRERVEMVAWLLEACDDPAQMTPELAARVGYFMESELAGISELLGRLEKEAQ